MLGVVEEVGELAHIYLKNAQSIRGMIDPEECRYLTMDAIGDIIIYLMDFCNRENIDIQEALETTWKSVSNRDWKKRPETG